MLSVSVRFFLTFVLLLFYPVQNLGLIGGSPSSYPFFALVPKGNQFCGGTVISANIVLTAAHCVYYESLNRWAFFTEPYVLHGNFSPVNEWSLRHYSCNDYLVHPKYDPKWHRQTSSFDIAVLRLVDRIANSINIVLKPCQVGFGNPDVFQHGLFFGLGSTNLQKPMRAEQLISSVLFLNPNCAHGEYFPFIKTPHVQICYNNINDVSMSLGDSGGPLVYQRRDSMKCVFGVYSFSTQCLRSGNYTGVFTNAQFLHTWISRKAKFLRNKPRLLYLED